MQNFDLENENGRSMIEMLGVLAIIGVLSVGGIAGYSKAMQKYRINKTIEQITLIAGNVRAFFSPQKNYIGVRCSGFYCNNNGCKGHTGGIDGFGRPNEANNGCPIIKKAKIFPDEMLTLSDDGAKIMGTTNLFGFPVSLDVINKNINDNKAFGITYYIEDNVEVCIELMTQDWSTANVNAISLCDNLTYIYLKTPVSIDLASEKCAESISNTTVENKAKGYPFLTFYFDIDLNGTEWKSKGWLN